MADTKPAPERATVVVYDPESMVCDLAFASGERVCVMMATSRADAQPRPGDAYIITRAGGFILSIVRADRNARSGGGVLSS